MKLYCILASVVLFTGTSGQYYAQPPPPVQANQQQQRPPLNFQQSVAQAKDELKRIFAKDRPVQDSVANMQDYYEGVIESSRRDMHPRGRLRKPCKMLPDPEPGLVNPVLTQPTVPYVPLRRDEEFVGEFAPPLKLSGPELTNPNYKDNYDRLAPNYPGPVGPGPNYQMNYPGPVRANYPPNNPPNYPQNYPPNNLPNYPPNYAAPNNPNPRLYANGQDGYDPNVNPFAPPAARPVVDQNPLVGVPVFYTQTQTFYVSNPPADTPTWTPTISNGFFDFTASRTQTWSDGPTPTGSITATGGGFFGNIANWFGGSATATPTGTDFSSLQASLSSMQASLSSQAASLYSASASAYFAAMSASLAAQSASIASVMATQTATYTATSDY